jgi:hypothetical protein
MDLSYLIIESELLEHSKSFGFPLRAGLNEWNRQLQESWCSSIPNLNERAKEVLLLRANPEICESAMKQLQALQESEVIVLNHTPSETSSTAEEQIFFKGEHTKVLNHIPFIIVFFVFLKVWVAPCLALLTPVILCIMPYIILTTVMDMPIPWDMYIVMMKQMIFGLAAGESWSLKHYAQALWTTASVGQSMVTPFVTSYHTAKLDTTIVKRAEAFLRIHTEGNLILKQFQSLGILDGLHNKFPEIPTEPHELAAWMEDEPLGMKQVWKLLGRLTIIVTLASDSSWQPVNWNPNEPSLVLNNLVDLAISKEKVRTSTLLLKGHSLLTGPNRGGKSSCLRAILQQVLLGQTCGFTKEAQGSWNPFGLVFTRLKSRDSAGKESLFEMEVRMAAKILHTTRAKKHHTLVLIDELFHSTNPPDAETSAKMFLQSLWRLSNCKSIISTHIFSLCEAVTGKIQTLCCPAMLTPSGKLEYSYTLQPGISRISSVKEVLEEANLCA